MNTPPTWSKDQLATDREDSEDRFREKRYTEPLEHYLELFDEYQGIVEEVLEQTVDLQRLRTEVADLVKDTRKVEVLRYLSGPPVSEDDLKVLVKAKSLAARHLTADPELLDRIVDFIRDCHDRRRFPWFTDSWEPSERERETATMATTSLLAMRRLETLRRNAEKKAQEDLVAETLSLANFKEVHSRTVKTLAEAPMPGQFCRESLLGTRKADFIIGLLDRRTMALECKVSNSATNSIKRLNNDAAVKAVVWREEFGSSQIVTAAVLGGVYALRNLVDAQDKGLALFWVHDLAAMIDWMHSTDSAADLSTG